MKKYITIIIILVFGGGLIFLFNLNNKPENILVLQQNREGQLERSEYVIDESDMYSVDALQPSAAIGELTSSEEQWLVHMREEEKLARDVYTTLGDIWGMRIFSNIAGSEQTHANSVKVLLGRYGLTDPVKDNVVGIFTIPEMQKLYNDLISQGKLSLLEALKIGATVEDLDIYDLDKALSETKSADIQVAYKNLQKGSRNHMRSFVKSIESQGGTYSPVYISSSAYNAIISSPQEKGRMQ